MVGEDKMNVNFLGSIGKLLKPESRQIKLGRKEHVPE